MRSIAEKKDAPCPAEARGMRSHSSANIINLNAKDFAGRRPAAAARTGIAIRHYDDEHEYALLKAAARIPSAKDAAETGESKDHLQSDLHSIRTSAIFSTPRLPADFAGLNSPALPPADCSIAAGPSHLVTITSTAWAVFDKAGNQLLLVDLAAWFSDSAPDVIIFNPRVIYDQFSGRWMIIACGRSADGKSSCFLISVSQTRNPLGMWGNRALDAGLNGKEATGNLADSLGVGLDNAAVYLTANMFDESGSFQYAKLRILNKSALLAGEKLQWWDHWDLRNPDGSVVFGLQAAHTFGTPGVQYLVNATGDGQSLTKWDLIHPLTDRPQLTRRVIPTVGYQLAPNARQQGTSTEIETGDTRLVNVVFRNGLLWTAHTVAANWGEAENVSAIQWFQINTGAGVISQQHIYGHPSSYYFCPTLMVDGQGNLIMVFNRVSETEYPSLRFTGRLSTDTPGTLHSSALLKESFVPGQATWGSYNGAAVDTNDTKIWVVGQYPAAESERGTWIGETSYIASSAEGNPAIKKPAFV